MQVKVETLTQPEPPVEVTLVLSGEEAMRLMSVFGYIGYDYRKDSIGEGKKTLELTNKLYAELREKLPDYVKRDCSARRRVTFGLDMTEKG